MASSHRNYMLVQSHRMLAMAELTLAAMTATTPASGLPTEVPVASSACSAEIHISGPSQEDSLEERRKLRTRQWGQMHQRKARSLRTALMAPVELPPYPGPSRSTFSMWSQSTGRSGVAGDNHHPHVRSRQLNSR